MSWRVFCIAQDVLGYIICSAGKLAMHIHKVAVDPAHRRKGIASRLIKVFYIPERVAAKGLTYYTCRVPDTVSVPFLTGSYSSGKESLHHTARGSQKRRSSEILRSPGVSTGRSHP